MRALLKDREDGTLIALEVQEAVYDGELNELYLNSPEVTYVVEQVPENSAQAHLRALAESGFHDFTSYPAYLDD